MIEFVIHWQELGTTPFWEVVVDILDVDCANRAYRPVSVEEGEVEGVRYAHLVIEVPAERLVPRMTELRSFYVRKPSKEHGCWLHVPVDEIGRVPLDTFDTSVPPCDTNDAQVGHLETMSLLIEDDVVLAE